MFPHSEQPAIAHKNLFSERAYPRLQEAYDSWGIKPETCCAVGLAETPTAYKALMHTIIQEYFVQEEAFLSSVQSAKESSLADLSHSIPFEERTFTGHYYHRHALESFRLVGSVLSMLRLAGMRNNIREEFAYRELVPISDEDQFVVMVATLLHDYKTVVPNPHTADITSQFARAEDLQLFLDKVGVPTELQERIMHYQSITDYKRPDGWLYFDSKHEVVFNPPANGDSLTKEQALQLAIVWSDIAGQMAAPKYVQRRADDLGIIIHNPIPKGFKELLGYCERYGITLPETVQSVVRNLAAHRLLYAMKT